MNQEKVVKIKECINCETQFEITDKDLDFYNKISPKFEGTTYQIPTPTHCPDCRQQRRLAFRNERKLYKRNCDATGKPMISCYSPENKSVVYSQDVWWGDSWNAMDYGIDFDFNRGFFEQFNELLETVPMMSLTIQNSENCDFTNDVGTSKNSYLTFRTHESENIFYSYRVFQSRDCFDCQQIEKCENLFYCGNLKDCYNCKYSFYSENCRDSFLLWNCKNCNNCFNCYDLEGKQYCINNIQHTKQEYFSMLEKNINNMNFDKCLDNLSSKSSYNFPNIGSENCVGKSIKNSVNCFASNGLKKSENVKFGMDNSRFTDCYDCYSGSDASLCYEMTGSIRINNSFGCMRVRDAYKTYLSYVCFNVKNIFGCVGLRNTEYCIFNKQYTKGEYEKLVPKIIEHMKTTGEWGEFFPISISQFEYNDTVANDVYPLTEKQANEKGYKWQSKDYPINIPRGIDTIEANELSNDIKNIDESILKKAIICEKTGTPFRIIKTELEFYKKHSLPIPSRCPDQRYLDRFKFK